MKIKCMAIDDEPLALEQIGSYVQKTPFLELIATCKNAYEALDILKEKEVDLMFIDIDMPDISGLDLVKSLQNHKSYSPRIQRICIRRDFRWMPLIICSSR